MKKVIKFYCPYEKGLQAEASLKLLESEFPALPLNKTISPAGDLLEIMDRPSFLKAGMAAEVKIPLVTNGDTHAPVIFSGYVMKFQFGADIVKICFIVIEIADQLNPVSSFAHLMGALASILKPFWGTINTEGTERITALQLQPSGYEKIKEYGLPALNSPLLVNKADIPSNIGWINYWSHDTAKKINYHEAKEWVGSNACPHAVEGGEIIELTKEPLDINSEKHLDILKKMYDKFPRIGGRDL